MTSATVRWIGYVLVLMCCVGWLQADASAQERDRDKDVEAAARERMVVEQLISGIHGRAIQDARVLDAMRRVPRHAFVLPAYAPFAYADQALPIAAGQTISQPFIVALMTELAAIEPGDRVLEIGTGSGYQAAVLASLTDAVYSIEIIEELAHHAERTLKRLGYPVHLRIGDGFYGWPEAAPFDAILVTAAAPHVPQPLIDQLAEEGRLVIPLGEVFQELSVFRKTDGRLLEERVIPVRFVPMSGVIASQDVER